MTEIQELKTPLESIPEGINSVCPDIQLGISHTHDIHCINDDEELSKENIMYLVEEFSTKELKKDSRHRFPYKGVFFYTLPLFNENDKQFAVEIGIERNDEVRLWSTQGRLFNVLKQLEARLLAM